MISGRITVTLRSAVLECTDAKVACNYLLAIRRALEKACADLPPMEVEAHFEAPHGAARKGASGTPPLGVVANFGVAGKDECECGAGGCGGGCNGAESSATPRSLPMKDLVEGVVRDLEKEVKNANRSDSTLSLDNFVSGKRLTLYEVLQAKTPVLVTFWEGGKEVQRAFRVRHQSLPRGYLISFDSGDEHLTDHTAAAAKEIDPFVTSKGYRAYKLIAKRKAKA